MDNIITAIGELWKLVGLVVLGIFLIVYRELINSIFIKRNLKFKKGDTEFEVTSNTSAKEEQTVANEEVLATLEKASIESTSKEEIDTSSQFEKLFKAFSNRDKEELAKVIRDIEGSELDFNEKIKYKLVYYRMCYELGDTEAFNKLEEFSYKYKESKENYILILKHLCNIYMEINQYEKAFGIYQKLIDNCEDLKEKAELISKSSLCLLELKLNEKAINILIDAINKDESKDALFIYYTNLATVYERLQENELKVLALEMALQYSPNNTNIIFDIAYSYDKSNHNHKDLTLLHYNNLLKFEPNNTNALNNKGVACENLGLNGLKIVSYKKAIENGNSLASSNIAYKYIENGFYEEAKETLKEASHMENPHINVSKANTYLDGVIQTEKEKEKDIISKAIIKQRFFSKYAQSYFNISKNLNLSNSNWKLGESILIIEQFDNNIEGTWKENNTDYKFQGNIYNNTIKAKVSKNTYQFNSKTYQYSEIGIAYIYISNDNYKLNMLIIENEKGEHTIKKFEKFTRLE